MHLVDLVDLVVLLGLAWHLAQDLAALRDPAWRPVRGPVVLLDLVLPNLAERVALEPNPRQLESKTVLSIAAENLSAAILSVCYLEALNRRRTNTGASREQRNLSGIPCPTPRLIYIRTFPILNVPDAYLGPSLVAVTTGPISGKLICPPCVCPAIRRAIFLFFTI